MKYAMLIAAAAILVAGGVYFAERGRVTGGGETAAGTRAGPGRAPRQPPLVTVARVAQGRLEDTVDAIGTAKANESVTLTAKVTDKVDSVHFDDGDYVDAGTVLVQLRNREQDAQRAEAQANLDEAKSHLRRLRDLSKRGLAAASDLDTAETDVAAAQARLDSVVAQLQDRVVRAPFAGLLGFREVSPGTLITPTTPITTLDDISTIKLDFTVPETFLAAVSAGAGVAARSASYPQREFQGVVRTVGSRVDPVTRAITVRADIPNKDRALKPGMLLTVRVVTAERSALVIPESAVYQMEDRAYVYRVDASLHAHQQQIKLGERRFGRVEVLEGLSEGDRIVTSGLVKLRDGVQVRLADENQALSGLPAAPKDVARAGNVSDF